jgi:hypothetical protein
MPKPIKLDEYRDVCRTRACDDAWFAGTQPACVPYDTSPAKTTLGFIAHYHCPRCGEWWKVYFRRHDWEEICRAERRAEQRAERKRLPRP